MTQRNNAVYWVDKDARAQQAVAHTEEMAQKYPMEIQKCISKAEIEQFSFPKFLLRKRLIAFSHFLCVIVCLLWSNIALIVSKSVNVCECSGKNYCNHYKCNYNIFCGIVTT